MSQVRILARALDHCDELPPASAKFVAIEPSRNTSTPRPSVLFLCVHNAGRSQMAAGWMRHLAGETVNVYSGGSEPADQVNPVAVAAMAEKGIDISRHVPERWSDETVKAADVVVTMGCGDECPYFPGKRYVDWELVDPSGKPIDEVRPIRDEIERRVKALLAELEMPISGVSSDRDLG